jgi:hypothetical protein
MNAPVKKDPSPKCFSCYWAKICMLTNFMRALCGGPFKDKAEHLKFVDDHIKGQKFG